MNHRSALRSKGSRTLASRLSTGAAVAATLGFAAFLSADLVSAASPFQDDAQAAKKQAQDATTKKQVGRGRLSGRQAPPKPASVPAASRRTVPKTDRPTTQKPSTGDLQPPPVTRALTEEQQKARAEYEAKVKQGAKPGYGAAPRPPRNPNAKLEVDFGTDKHDFGRARQGDMLTHTFELRSAGTEPVVISQASPTCGCTLGEIKVQPEGTDAPMLYNFGDPIAPGTKIELAATLDTKSKRNKTNVRINVYSNDGKTGVTMLALSANVEPFLVATPQFLQLGDVREGTEKTGTIDFRTSSGERVLLTQDPARPIPVPEGLAVNFEPISPDESGRSNLWRATFTISPDSPEGGKSYALRLDSDIELPKSEKPANAPPVKPGTPTVYQVTANINYRILGALSLQPQYVSLGLVRPGQPVVRNVRLTSHEPDFDLSNVTAEVVGEGNQPLNWADRFAATVKPVSGSNAVDIELRLEGLPEEADGSFRGRVLIKTGHPSKPEEFFRFSGVCRKLAGNAARPQPAKPPVVKKGAGK